MLLSRTKNQPAHYMLEIEDFSVFSEDPTINIISDTFEASGFKWILELYPNKRDEENGETYISLYLILSDAYRLPSYSNKFHFDVKFFVYDHIRCNYVTFQDVDGKRIHFHEKQPKWGFDKLISVEHFRDSSKGHLLDDSCVFGVEVFAVPQPTPLKDRCLSMIKPPATMNTYKWTVDNFSTVTKRSLTSEVVRIGKVKWTLTLYPNGIGFGPEEDLYVYLRLHKPELVPSCWNVYAKFDLRVKSQTGYDDTVETRQRWMNGGSDYPLIMNSIELRDTKKGFLMNDRLTVEAKFSVIGMLKNNF